MKRRRFLTTAIAASTIPTTIAGCLGGGGGGGDGDSSDGGDGAGSGTTVEMKDTSFDPTKASVDPGTKVVWKNEDSVAHTVTSAQFHDVATSWSVDVKVSGGGSTSHAFDSKGIYEYYCTIHGKGTMCGAVLVGDVSLEEDLPCAGGGDEGGLY